MIPLRVSSSAPLGDKTVSVIQTFRKLTLVELEKIIGNCEALYNNTCDLIGITNAERHLRGRGGAHIAGGVQMIRLRTMHTVYRPFYNLSRTLL